jgi:hypothetical protein
VLRAMKTIRVAVHSRGNGHENTDEIAKNPGFNVVAVFPLEHVYAGDDYRDFFVLLRPEE